MINRRIIISAVSIVSALTITGAATFAAFTDTAQSTGNTFSTGSSDLQISKDTADNPTGYGNDISGPAFSELTMFPGFTNGYKFWLKNNSSAPISFNLAATFDNVVTSGLNPDIANQLTSQFTCKSDTDSNGSLDTTIGTSGTFSINSWDTGSDNLGQLGPNDSTSDGRGTDEAQCVMTMALPGSLDSSYQSSGVTFDGKFTGTQTP